jgi:hypothetical protein
MELNWSGVLIEADPKSLQKIRYNSSKSVLGFFLYSGKLNLVKKVLQLCLGGVV